MYCCLFPDKNYVYIKIDNSENISTGTFIIQKFFLICYENDIILDTINIGKKSFEYVLIPINTNKIDFCFSVKNTITCHQTFYNISTETNDNELKIDIID